ncbi:uncharacterized protein LOC115326678 [Ixodes scapularis]|uniref:uncharacterized protein LOC115326678 n=1 Tax=Ixodes scapularis TaxID=6945 RepID=UPI001A9F7A23|nr:uncharacterized protein LOC115326678 [Ixodes scapularis]
MTKMFIPREKFAIHRGIRPFTPGIVSAAQSKLRKYVERLEQSKTSRATEKKAYKEQIAALKAELRRLQDQQQSLPQNAPRNRQPEQERPSVPFQFRPPASNQTLFSTSSSCASDLPASRGHSAGFSDRAKTPRMDFQQRTSAPIQGFGGANRTPLMNFQQQRPPNTGSSVSGRTTAMFANLGLERQPSVYRHHRQSHGSNPSPYGEAPFFPLGSPVRSRIRFEKKRAHF